MNSLVVLVDDDTALLRYAAKFIERLGYPVAACRTAAEARARAESATLAVIDLSISDEPGEELCASLLSQYPRLRCILWSGNPFDVSDLTARFAGRVEFVQKPFAPKLLHETVERLLTS